MNSPFPPPRSRTAFTLTELLVSMALLTIIMLLMVNLTSFVQNVYSRTQTKTEQVGKAREAYESITRKLSQATLNTYWDYDNPNDPSRYKRQSELRFITGEGSALLPNGAKPTTPTHAVFFQAPFGEVDSANYRGLENLLNTWGYFIEFGSDENIRPSILPNSVPFRYRYRLFELREPSENLGIYSYTSGQPTYNGTDWFQDPLKVSPANSRPVRVLAENVVALILTVKDPNQTSLTADYVYDTAPGGNAVQPDSEHQLPPMVQVTMVVIDESSAARLAATNGSSPPPLLDNSWFTETGKFDEDLADLKEALTDAAGVNYRVFTSTVSIRGAKWSRD